MVILQDDGTIVNEETEVGYIGWCDNIIIDVFVGREHRNNGYATEAVSQVVKRVQKDYDIIRVNTVLTPEMETVLDKNDFQNKIVTRNTVNFSGIPSVDTLPEKEKTVWYKNLE